MNGFIKKTDKSRVLIAISATYAGAGAPRWFHVAAFEMVPWLQSLRFRLWTIFSTEEVLLQGQKRNFTSSLICVQKLKLASFCGQRE
jgi:hypothetical protein